MIVSPLPPTTHTVVMSQLADLNKHLHNHANPVTFTAGELGLAGAKLLSGSAPGGLPEGAVLDQLRLEGPPEYPYIYGHFLATGSSEAHLVVELHTAALRELSRRFGLQHGWGD